ncbi:MAG: hypothetical protein PHY33_07025 [Methanobacteriaceae archaeon]|jgi:hypothetical protein|nr:hypothetical protein [Methanobacteriaceae archaeon]
MNFRKIQQIIRNNADYEMMNYYLKSVEYKLPLCDFIIDKDTINMMIFRDVNGVTLFKSGFMVIHSPFRMVDSVNIDFIDIETFNIEVK